MDWIELALEARERGLDSTATLKHLREKGAPDDEAREALNAADHIFLEEKMDTQSVGKSGNSNVYIRSVFLVLFVIGLALMLFNRHLPGALILFLFYLFLRKSGLLGKPTRTSASKSKWRQ